MPRVKKNQTQGTKNDPQGQADKLKEQGNESIKNGNIDKAINQYSQAIELKPDNHIYYNNRSLAYYINEQYQQSYDDAKKSLEINKSYLKAYIRVMNACIELDLLEEAQKYFKLAQDNCEQTDDLKDIEIKIEEEWKLWNKLPSDHKEVQIQNKMIQWLKDGHSDFPKLKMQYYSENYRGVHACQKIYNKQVICYIPLSHLITLEMAKSTSVSKKILAAKLDLLSPKHSFLSTFLLQEKYKQNSKWKVYLDILPSNYDQFPIFYSQNDLQWLVGSPFLNQVKDKINDIRRDYEEICQVSEEFQNYSFSDFCWARMTASSRIFGLTIEGQKTDAFVPLADMLNHKRPKQTSWSYSDERGGFIIEAMEDINRGSQIYDSYGRKCNSRFLLNYGFIVQNNDANEVALRVYFNKNDPTLQLKYELMQEEQEFKQYRIQENYEEQNNIEFLGYIRYVCLEDKDKIYMLNNLHEQQILQEHRSKNNGYKPSKTPPLSVENETQMWNKFKEICQTQLSQYQTTLKEDQELLKEDKFENQNQKNCTLLRSGEKQILVEMIKTADKIVPLLSKSKKEIQQLMLKGDYYKYSNYINKVVLQLILK